MLPKIPIDQLVGMAGTLQGYRYELLEDVKNRNQTQPLLPLCKACESSCKVHDAKGLIVFVCHAHRRLKKRT
jgi:hypothetical protein